MVGTALLGRSISTVSRLALRERQLAERLVTIQEETRTLVAREIHDGLVQKLTGALMLFQAYEEQRQDNLDDPRCQTLKLAIELLRV